MVASCACRARHLLAEVLDTPPRRDKSLPIYLGKAFTSCERSRYENEQEGFVGEKLQRLSRRQEPLGRRPVVPPLASNHWRKKIMQRDTQ